MDVSGNACLRVEKYSAHPYRSMSATNLRFCSVVLSSPTILCLNKQSMSARVASECINSVEEGLLLRNNVDFPPTGLPLNVLAELLRSRLDAAAWRHSSGHDLYVS